jgi:hypothetical protein
MRLRSAKAPEALRRCKAADVKAKETLKRGIYNGRNPWRALAP